MCCGGVCISRSSSSSIVYCAASPSVQQVIYALFSYKTAYDLKYYHCKLCCITGDDRQKLGLIRLLVVSAERGLGCGTGGSGLAGCKP